MDIKKENIKIINEQKPIWDNKGNYIIYNDVITVEDGVITIRGVNMPGTEEQIREMAWREIQNKIIMAVNDNDTVFYRCTDNRDEDPNFCSTNYAKGIKEKGLSVARTPHYGVWGYKYVYKVSGTVIGTGSDGEPLLDPKTIKVLSEKVSPRTEIKRWRKAAAVAAKKIFKKGLTI